MAERIDSGKYSINPKSTLTERKLHVQYLTSAGVQVRDETFGLLFYNYRGPRLYFVPSKDLIDAEFFGDRRSVNGLIESICARMGWSWTGAEKRITLILIKLKRKSIRGRI
jgi:putative mycofactocin binding protein MftB